MISEGFVDWVYVYVIIFSLIIWFLRRFQSSWTPISPNRNTQVWAFFLLDALCFVCTSKLILFRLTGVFHPPFFFCNLKNLFLNVCMWIPCRNRMNSGVNLPVSAVLVLALIGFWWWSWCEIFWLLSDVNFTTNLEMQNLLWILIRLILDHVVVWKFSAIFLVLVILSSVSGETEENKKRIILSVLRY